MNPPIFILAALFFFDISMIEENHFIKSEFKNNKWLKEAVLISNDILDPDLGIKLKFTADISAAKNQHLKIIPITLASQKDDYMIYVPEEGDKIVVHPKKLKKYLDFYCKEDQLQLGIEIKYICAVMLLHEVGHIVNGDPGSFGLGGPNPDFNREDTEAKKREFLADKFAAQQIKAVIEKGDENFFGWNTSIAVSNFVWNLSKKRMIDNFGETWSVFWDQSYSHPNLELRFLIMQNELVDESLKEDSQELINQFLKSRESAEPYIYRKN